MTTAAQHRRLELQRRILEVLGSARGSGELTAADVVSRLHGRDGRKVAGMLRHLRTRGLAIAVNADECDIVEKYDWDRDQVKIRIVGPRFRYRITPAGTAWLTRQQRDQPRLTDPPPRSWPRRRAAAPRQG